MKMLRIDVAHIIGFLFRMLRRRNLYVCIISEQNLYINCSLMQTLKSSEKQQLLVKMLILISVTKLCGNFCRFFTVVLKVCLLHSETEVLK
jgi:hypothetical protein